MPALSQGVSTASGDRRRRSTSEGGGLGGSRRRDEAPPLLDLPEPDGAVGGAPPPLLHVSQEAQEEVDHGEHLVTPNATGFIR